MYILKNNLKPGMILSKDIILNDKDNTVLLVKGQVLDSNYIDKILFYNIPGIHVVNKFFDKLKYESVIDDKLEKKALSGIRDVIAQVETNDGKITDESVNKFSEIVDELVDEITVKKELNNSIMEFRNHDEYTYQHCLSVANLSISAGISMGLNKKMLHDIGMAGFLHDMGKLRIPSEIINKPGKLTTGEFTLMKKHPLFAMEMLKNQVSDEILEGIGCHHEKVDGTGYPFGKKQDDISLYGRILSICDVYHALSSDRSYRKSCFPNEVMEYMMGNADIQFDYDILCIFLKSVVAFPVGCFVRLSNGKMGVVVKNYIENNMRPKIRVIQKDKSVGEDIDLLNDHHYMNVTIIDKSDDISQIIFRKSKLA